MALRESVWRVVKGAGMWLYCRLRLSLYWIAKVSGNCTIIFRRWLKKGGRKKYLVKLGQAVHALHLEGRTNWSDDIRVKESIQALEDGDRKTTNLNARLREREVRYQEQVKRFREARSYRPTKSEDEGTANSRQQAVK